MLIDELKKLNDEIRSCQKCPLYQNGKVVLGRAGKQVKIPIDLMIVGEAPGAEEAQQGLAFVGRSGKLLDEWIKAFETDNYLITNVVKHRPIDNNNRDRPPTKEEVDACKGYLIRQIELFKPKKILALGQTALSFFVPSANIGDVVNSKKIFKYTYNGGEATLFAYYHPAYILRNLTSNWQDQIKDLAEKITGKKEVSASELWSTSGVKNLMEKKELEETQKVDDELSYPLIISTEYSLLDYGGKLEDEMKYLKAHGAKNVIIADKNTTAAFIKMEKLRQFGVNIYYGAKISIDNFEAILVVMNQEGYQNLNKIVSYVNLSEPNLNDLVDFIIKNKNGLKLILTPTYQPEDIEIIKRLASEFAEKYVASSFNYKAKIKAKFLLDNINNASLIVYQNNKFTQPQDYDVYLTILAIKQHKKYSEVATVNKEENAYIHTLTELKNEFGDEADAIINNLNALVGNISYIIPKGYNLLPKVEYKFDYEPTNDEIIAYAGEKQIELDEDGISRVKKELQFWHLIKQKDLTSNYELYAKKHNISIDEAKQIYEKRLQDEFEIISSKKFIDYFLLIKSMYDYAKAKDKVISAGRGSVGGSLIAYCLEITQVDPVLFDLLFERFINPERHDLPDVDCDFQSTFRPELIKFLTETYGAERTIPAGTILSFKTKSALNEVGKALGVPKYVLDEISSLLIVRTSGDARSGHMLEETFDTFPQLNKYKEQYPKFFEISAKIEGQKKARGTHASGIMVLQDAYYHYFSLEKTPKGVTTSFEYPELEEYGLVKIDLLGLSTLDVIADVTKKNNIRVNYMNPDGKNGLEDPEVYKLIQAGYTAGLFEIHTHAMTRMAYEATFSFDDLIALNAYDRPAPNRYGIPGKYKMFKKTGVPFSIGVPAADKILSQYPLFYRFGNLILFQEQIMVIFNTIGNFYSVHSNSAVKAIAKSKGITTFFQQYGQMFIEGAKKNGYSEEEAKKIFNQVYQFGSFAFNASHATLYAATIYYTAWLKAHYPIDYYIASYYWANESEKNEIVSEMIARGYKIYPPDVNVSDKYKLTYRDGVFYMPLTEIKYLSSKQMDDLIRNRPFNSVEEAIQKLKLPSRVADSLRKTTISGEFNIEQAIISGTKPPLLIANKDKIIPIVERLTGVKISSIKEIIKRKDRTGWYLAIHLGKPHYSSIGDWIPVTQKPTQEEIEKNPRYGIIKKYGWMSRWCKLITKDQEGTDGYVNVMPDVYDKYKDKIAKINDGSLLLLNVKTGAKIDQRQTANEIIFLSDYADKLKEVVKEVEKI